MNKLKGEELLEWLKENIDRYAFLQISHPHLAYYPTERDKQAYQQIKGKIKKSWVTEDFVEKWNQIIAERVNVQMKKNFIREEISLVYPGTENLTQMLKEVGMEVVKEKK